MAETMARGWMRRRAAICAGFYLAALLAVLAYTFGSPALYTLGLRQEQSLTLVDAAAENGRVTAPDTAEFGEGAFILRFAAAGAHTLWMQAGFTAAEGYEIQPAAMYLQTAAGKTVYAQKYGDWYAFSPLGGTDTVTLTMEGLPAGELRVRSLLKDRRLPPVLCGAAVLWAVLLPGAVFALLDRLLALIVWQGRRGKEKTAKT